MDQGSNNTIEQFFAYAYDANDRLLTESLDNGMDAIIEQITSYGWGTSNLGTQQTGKVVHDQTSNLDTSRVSYGYDLQGRMEVVTTETLTGASVTRREKVTFDYDHTGIRVSALQETDATADGTFETRTLTEYLIDPQNFTGYQQVLIETVKNADTGEIQKSSTIRSVMPSYSARTTTEFFTKAASSRTPKQGPLGHRTTPFFAPQRRCGTLHRQGSVALELHERADVRCE